MIMVAAVAAGSGPGLDRPVRSLGVCGPLLLAAGALLTLRRQPQLDRPDSSRPLQRASRPTSTPRRAAILIAPLPTPGPLPVKATRTASLRAG